MVRIATASGKARPVESVYSHLSYINELILAIFHDVIGLEASVSPTAELSQAAGIRRRPNPNRKPRLRGPEVVWLVGLGHAFYVLSGRRLDACWAIRLISVDVRDGGDVNLWLATD